MRFEFIAPVSLNIMVFWDVTSYRLVDEYQRFEPSIHCHIPKVQSLLLTPGKIQIFFFSER
jgi:hypothetical protein